MTPRTNQSEIVYILERFPGDTLNFVYNEIRGLESAGVRVEIFSILPGRLCPDEARDFQDRTRNVRPVSFVSLVRAWGFFLLRKPMALLSLLATLPFDNSRPFWGKFLKTYAHLVYAVYFAWLLKIFVVMYTRILLSRPRLRGWWPSDSTDVVSVLQPMVVQQFIHPVATAYLRKSEVRISSSQFPIITRA